MAGLSQQIAQHLARTRFEDLPPEAVRAAKRSLLDAVSVSLAASGMGEGCGPFIDLARAAGPPTATVLGAGVRSNAQMAALANGALAHAMDFEDAYDGAPIHPNAAVVPVILALGESLGRSGREALTALAVGCDLACRIGLSLTENPDRYGWYPPPIIGAFGAAAAGASLLRLSSEQTSNALALTLCQATANSQFKTSPHSHVRSVRDAFAAQAGLLAAQLASAGVIGFDEPLEGNAGLFQLYARGAYDPDRLMDGLGRRFEGVGVAYKAWPACRGTHAFIEAALELRAQEPDLAAQVTQIGLAGGALQRMLVEPPAQKAAPKTAIDAKFSLPFAVALALVRGRVGLADFDAESLVDAEILRVAALARYEVADGWGDGMTSGEVKLVLKDGRVLDRRVITPYGNPARPIGDHELKAKFLTCASYALNPATTEQTQRLANDILRIEHFDRIDQLPWS